MTHNCIHNANYRCCCATMSHVTLRNQLPGFLHKFASLCLNLKTRLCKLKIPNTVITKHLARWSIIIWNKSARNLCILEVVEALRKRSPASYSKIPNFYVNSRQVNMFCCCSACCCRGYINQNSGHVSLKFEIFYAWTIQICGWNRQHKTLREIMLNRAFTCHTTCWTQNFVQCVPTTTTQQNLQLR